MRVFILLFVQKETIYRCYDHGMDFVFFFPALFSYYFYLFTNKEKPGIATTFVTKGRCFNLGAVQKIWSGRGDEDKMMIK